MEMVIKKPCYFSAHYFSGCYLIVLFQCRLIGDFKESGICCFSDVDVEDNDSGGIVMYNEVGPKIKGCKK